MTEKIIFKKSAINFLSKLRYDTYMMKKKMPCYRLRGRTPKCDVSLHGVFSSFFYFPSIIYEVLHKLSEKCYVRHSEDDFAYINFGNALFRATFHLHYDVNLLLG